jgi:hypothetical protein
LLFDHAAQQEHFVFQLLDFGFEIFAHRVLCSLRLFANYNHFQFSSDYPNRPVT